MIGKLVWLTHMALTVTLFFNSSLGQYYHPLVCVRLYPPFPKEVIHHAKESTLSIIIVNYTPPPPSLHLSHCKLPVGIWRTFTFVRR